MSGRSAWKSARFGLFRPFSPFFCLFCSFLKACIAPGRSRKRKKKKPFSLRYPRIRLSPHLRHSNLGLNHQLIRHPDSSARRRPNLYFFHHSFCKFKRERSENVFGKSDFYWPLMVLAEQWQCSLHANKKTLQRLLRNACFPKEKKQTNGTDYQKLRP